MGKVMGNQTTVSYGTGGRPLVTSSAGLGTPYVYGNVGINTTGPGVLGKVSVPLGDTGKTVPVTASSFFTRPSFAKALIASAKIGGGIAGGVVGSIALGALADYVLNPRIDPVTGDLIADDPDAAWPPATGFEYGHSQTASGNNLWGYPTHEAACLGAGIGFEAKYPEWDFELVTSTAPMCRYKLINGPYNNGSLWDASIAKRAGGCPVGTYVMPNGDCSPVPGAGILTEQQVRDKIAENSGWPTSSALALQGILGEPDSRKLLELDKQQGVNIVGPTSVPGTSTETNTQTRLIPGTTIEAAPGTATETQPGTKTITSTNTHNVTYQGDKLTYNTTNITNTTITNNVTGDTITNQQTTQTSDDAKPQEQTDFCEAHPDSIACKKIDLDTPDADVPKDTASVSYTVEDSWGSGSCPSNVYGNINGQSVLLYDWAQTCGYVSTYIRPLLLLMCALGALFIIMPGRADA